MQLRSNRVGLAHHGGQRRRVLAGGHPVPEAEQAVEAQDHHCQEREEHQPRVPHLPLRLYQGLGPQGWAEHGA